MNQVETILDHLKFVGPITPLEAWRRYKVYRISAVIHTLRKKHIIRTEDITVEGVTFAEYHYERPLEYKKELL